MDVIGGFARGEVQRRIMADVFGMPIAVPDNLVEATSMGAAIIGGVGVGLPEGFDAVERFRTIVSVVEPDPAASDHYSELLAVFAECYRDLEPTFGRLANRSTTD